MIDAENLAVRGAGEYKMEILEKSDNKIVFVLKDINYTIANTLRRLINSEVCTLAIEDVTIKKNSSALYDEMLAHRLGLVPLKTDLKSYTKIDQCKCKGKGCESCNLILTLKAKGPCNVYASELKSKDPKVIPVYPNILILKLLKNQEIDIEATAILSCGKDHAKFSPGLVYYFGYPRIKAKTDKISSKAADACPVNILEVEDGKLKIKNIEKCTLCKACEEYSIEAKGDEKDFIFTIESWGQLTIKEIVTEAVKKMEEKLDEFEGLIKKIK